VSARKLKDLPGWEAATVEAAKRIRDDGSVYQYPIGDWLRTIGAFVAPPSVDHVTADLVKAFLVGLVRQKALGEIARRQESPDKVVNIRDARERRNLRRLDRQRLEGNWDEHWTATPGTKVPGL
jgi:hypothetical protein